MERASKRYRTVTAATHRTLLYTSFSAFCPPPALHFLAVWHYTIRRADVHTACRAPLSCITSGLSAVQRARHALSRASPPLHTFTFTDRRNAAMPRCDRCVLVCPREPTCMALPACCTCRAALSPLSSQYVVPASSGIAGLSDCLSVCLSLSLCLSVSLSVCLSLSLHLLR